MKLQDFLREELQALKDQSLYNELSVLDSPQDHRVIINGKKVIMFCANNYLGFANHPRLREAAKKAIDKWGFGAGAVRQLAGTMRIHMQLEEELAKFKRTEDSLVFTAGIAANRGTIQALFGEGDVIISDELNHGSIIDGVRLTKAEKKIYPHKNMEELEKVLKESHSFKKRLIVTDGVFSVDGDITPLDRIVKLAHEYDAIVMVDDAHGEGVIGKDGGGTVSHFNLHGKVDIEMGTFSKAFGAIGGFIAGSRELKHFLVNRARSFIFSCAHPPGTAAACLEAVRMIQDEPIHLKRLWDNTRYFQENMRDLGFDLGVTQSPITPVIVGESSVAQDLSKGLFDEGVFIKPIVYPLVAKDKARVRAIVNANHTREDLDEVLSAFEKVGQKLRII